MANDNPRVNIRFLYSFCNDVDEMKTFYTDLLGMEQGSYMNKDDFGWLTYKVDGLELMFFRWDTKLPPQADWAWQPGESIEEAKAHMSFSLEYDIGKFREVVAALTKAEVKSQKPKPTWRQQSYWGWTVMDPMGNTIEVYASPKEKPEAENPEWPE